MTDEQFVEFFYRAVEGRRVDAQESEGRTALVVALVALEETRASTGPSIFVAALPENHESEWVDDAPICQEGTCHDCGLQLESWAKRVRCPACGSSAYLT